MSDAPGNPWENDPNAGGYPPPAQPGVTPQGQPGVPPQGQPGMAPPGPGGQQYGQPGPGPSGFGQQAGFTPPPVKKKPWGKIFLGCGGLLLLSLIGVGACSFFVFKAATEPINNTNDFLAAVQDGDIAEAEGLVADGCDADAAINAVSSLGTLSSYNMTSYNNTNGNEVVSGTVTIDGISRQVQFSIQDDKVCRAGG